MATALADSDVDALSGALDQREDRGGHTLYRLTTLYPLPDFVKAANQTAICGDDETPTHLFADVPRRAFPMHTAAATLVSSAFFYDGKEAQALPGARQAVIEKRLRDQAAFFGVLADVDRIKTAAADQHNLSLGLLPDTHFAYVWQPVDGGPVQRHWPMRNAEEVKTAAESLQRYRDSFRFEDRQRMAVKIAAAAERLHVDLPAELLDQLDRQSGYGTTTRKKLASALRQRAWLVPHGEFRDYLNEAAAGVEAATGRIPNTVLQKAARLLDQLDQEFKLVGQYGEALERPEDVVYYITKQAAERILDDSLETTSGSVYAKEALAGLRVAQLREVLGNEVADSVTNDGLTVDLEKLATVVRTLPRPDAQLFDTLVSSLGVMPVMKTAGVATRRLFRRAS